MPRKAHVKPVVFEISTLPESPTVEAIIPTFFTENGIHFGNPLPAPNGWSISGTTISLEPTQSQGPPAWYRFAFVLESSTHTLKGIGVFSEGHSDTTIFFQAMANIAIVNLLDNLTGSSGNVSYHMDVYLHLNQNQNSRAIVVDDPTITFEPQGGGS